VGEAEAGGDNDVGEQEGSRVSAFGADAACFVGLLTSEAPQIGLTAQSSTPQSQVISNLHTIDTQRE